MGPENKLEIRIYGDVKIIYSNHAPKIANHKEFLHVIKEPVAPRNS